MKQILITSEDLIKFMGEYSYYKFIEYLRKVNKISKDEPIWIIGEYCNK